MVLVYPAVFSRLEDGSFLVRFPDLDGATAQGVDLADALEVAGNYANLWLLDRLENGGAAPSPSDVKTVESAYPNDVVSLILVDPDRYSQCCRKLLGNEVLSECSDKLLSDALIERLKAFK